MPTVVTTSGKRFDARDGETLLDAASRCGIVLAYSCRTGRCSTCKARILSGATKARLDETGLESAERDTGWILSCVREATTDVVVDIEDLGDVELYPAKTLPCRIHSLQRLNVDVMQVLLRLPPNNQFLYHPGQYIDVIGAGGVRRSYSIANAPRTDGMLELHVRAVAQGALSGYWFGEAKANDLLRLTGPIGTFFPRNVEAKDLVFLATGTGIAPVKAILEGLAQCRAERPRSVTVLWGGRVKSDLYWSPEAGGGSVHFTPVLSRSDDTWQGARGHVQDVFLSAQPVLNETEVYACGSDAMIHSARRQLVAAGLPEKAFHSDAFVCSAGA